MKTEDNECRATGAMPNLEAFLELLRKIFKRKK